MIVKTAKGDGQGQCTLCKKRGRYNRTWMCFLYEVQGKDGVYCGQCVREFAYLERITHAIDLQEKWLRDAGLTPYNVGMAFNAIKLALNESEVDTEDVE